MRNPIYCPFMGVRPFTPSPVKHRRQHVHRAAQASPHTKVLTPSILRPLWRSMSQSVGLAFSRFRKKTSDPAVERRYIHHSQSSIINPSPHSHSFTHRRSRCRWAGRSPWRASGPRPHKTAALAAAPPSVWLHKRKVRITRIGPPPEKRGAPSTTPSTPATHHGLVVLVVLNLEDPRVERGQRALVHAVQLLQHLLSTYHAMPSHVSTLSVLLVTASQLNKHAPRARPQCARGPGGSRTAHPPRPPAPPSFAASPPWTPAAPVRFKEIGRAPSTPITIHYQSHTRH